LPVVATRAGALAETVVDGETGLLVDPGDTDGLANALLASLDDRSLAERHGAAARARCEREFDIRRCARAYIDLFRPEQEWRHRSEGHAVAALRRASR
ncbi:MAG: glycosyltransferase, partial [Gaiellaceae bacterium]